MLAASFGSFLSIVELVPLIAGSHPSTEGILSTNQKRNTGFQPQKYNPKSRTGKYF
jgi:hypothetical protein